MVATAGLSSKNTMWSRIASRLYKQVEKTRRSIAKRGRIAAILASVPADAVILEIGGGYNPRYPKAQHPRVYHLDHDTTEGLRAKYGADPTVADRIDRIQQIDFVFRGGPIEQLVPFDLRFDLIFGSHVLEHQVDLIGHLQSLEKLLKPGGRVIEMIPDLRTCFDALRYPSVTSDVLVAHRRGAPTHRGKEVFDFLSRQLNSNHGFLMRDADFDGGRFVFSLQHALQAMEAADLPGTPYLDTHAWTFTPESFRLLMIELRLLGLVRLVPTFVSPQYGNQFCAVLEPAPDSTLTPDAVQALERERFALARDLRV
jgi:SAM-dependent methyltransferase